MAAEILSYYPLPNLPGNTRNYVRDADSEVDRNNYDVKLNWNRTPSHQIWGKYSQMDAVVSNLFYLGVDGGGNGDTAVKQFTVGQTWTLNSNTVLDSTFGFSRQNQDVLASDFALGNFGTDTLGIPGHQRRDVVRRRPALRGLPVVQPRLQRHRQQRRMEPARIATSGRTRFRPTSPS